MQLPAASVASAASLALLLGAPGDASAQAKYPTKTIEVVVPFAPGGGTDNMMRMITGIMEENKWSPQPINVNNRPGGSGTIGYSYLISKKGDSHVVAGATPMIVSGKLQGRLPGNHRDAMTVLMIVAIDELMLSVRSESPYKTVEEFVAAARAKPGQLTVGGTGTHNEDHIFAHLFEQAAKIKLKYVPFNSGGEVTAALMGGHIDAGIMNPNEIDAQVEAGKAKNLAVAAKKRMTGAPDVPTFAEKGFPFYWEQMRARRRAGGHGARGRGLVAGHAEEGHRDQEVAGRVHQGQPAHADHLDRRGSQQVPRQHHRRLRERARRARRPEEVRPAGTTRCAALTDSPARACWRWASPSPPAR